MKRHAAEIHLTPSTGNCRDNDLNVPAIPAALPSYRASRSLRRLKQATPGLYPMARYAKVVPILPSSSIVMDASWDRLWDRLWADSAALKRISALMVLRKEAWMMHVDRTQPIAFPSVVEGIVDMLAGIAGDLAGGARTAHVEAIQEEQRTHFIVTVCPSDLEKVAGPRGRTAGSLRVIVRAAGIKQDRDFSLSIRSSGSLD